jgi:hypothetical protein
MSLILNGTTGVSGVDGTAATPALQGNDSNTGVSFGTDTVTINTGGVARVTTDASGDVGIGVTPNAWSTVTALQMAGPSMWGGTGVGHWTVNNYFDGSNYRYIDSNFATDYYQFQGSHVWRTAPSGTAGNAISFTQAMTLNADGNLMVGTTTAIGKLTVNGNCSLNSTQQVAGYASTLVMDCNGSSYYGVMIKNRSASNSSAITFINNSDVVNGSISVSTTATAYNTSSDYRLKENVAPMTGALATVSALKPCTYTWKSDGSNGQGFIAHELQAVVPDCVTGEKDAVDAEGNPQYQGVDTSFLVATLVSAIQELTARLEVLENK